MFPLPCHAEHSEASRTPSTQIFLIAQDYYLKTLSLSDLIKIALFYFILYT